MSSPMTSPTRICAGGREGGGQHAWVGGVLVLVHAPDTHLYQLAVNGGRAGDHDGIAGQQLVLHSRQQVQNALSNQP